MAECNIKLRHEGKPYIPRTCAKCKLGPCKDGQDYAGLTARVRELEAQLASQSPAEVWRRAMEAAAQKAHEKLERRQLYIAMQSISDAIRALPLPDDLR